MLVTPTVTHFDARCQLGWFPKFSFISFSSPLCTLERAQSDQEEWRFIPMVP